MGVYSDKRKKLKEIFILSRGNSYKTGTVKQFVPACHDSIFAVLLFEMLLFTTSDTTKNKINYYNL